MPQISVIVPVYNTEKYLRRCIDSILAQTFTDFELLLIDDGSTDQGGAICDGYAQEDSRILVFHQENKGQAAARNFALDWVFTNSKSEYFAFVDSDDWIHPRYLELLLNGITRYGVDICQCGYIRTDGTALAKEATADYSCVSPKEQFVGHYSAFIWGKLFRRHVWRQFRFPEGQIYEDLAIWYRILFSQEQIALLHAELYFYFFNPESTMNQNWHPGMLARLEAWDAQVAFFDQYGDEQLLKTALDHYCEVAKHEFYAIERSVRLTEDEKKKYSGIVKEKVCMLLSRHKRHIKSNPNYQWCLELAHPYAFSFCRRISRIVKAGGSRK